MKKVAIGIEKGFSGLIKHVAMTIVLCCSLPSFSNANPVEIPYIALDEIPKCIVTSPDGNKIQILEDVSIIIPGGAVSAPGTSFSSLEEKFINGVAEFMVTRAKAEAALYFQTKLKEDLCDNKSANRKYVPNLCVALDSLELSMSLNSMGGYLRAAVKKDIENIPDAVLEDMVDKAREKPDLNNLLTISRIIYPIYRASKDGRQPIDIFRGISETSLTCANGSLCEGNYFKYIKLASFILRAYEKKASCIDTNNQIQLKTITETNLKEGISELDSKMSANSITLPILGIDRIKTIVSDFEQIKDKLIRIQKLNNIIKEPVRYGLNKEDYDPRQRLTERLEVVEIMLDVMNILAKDSFKIMNDTSQPSEKADLENFVKQLGKLRESAKIAKELLKGDEATYMTAFLSFASQEVDNVLNNPNNKAIPDSVKKVIPVMVEIANAETSKDVAAVIEAAAAPVGSYREKSKRSMMSVTGFVGIAGLGKEYYKVDNESRSEEIKIQPFAPLGIHATFRDECIGGYAGLFFSIIDLGPLVSTHNENGVESQPNTGFKQVFSPGVYLTHQLYGPLSIGYGISQTPELIRTKTVEGVTTWRHQAFIAIDLTLFPF